MVLAFSQNANIFMERKLHLIRTVVRFSGIGLVATLSYVAICSLLVRFGYTPWIVSVLCYGAFIPIVYLIQRRFTFNSDAPHASSFVKYAATQVFGLLLSAFLPYFALRLVSPTASFIIVTLLVAIFNYLVLSHWAFKYKKD